MFQRILSRMQRSTEGLARGAYERWLRQQNTPWQGTLDLQATSPKGTPLPERAWQALRYATAGRGVALHSNERKLLQLRNCHAGQRAFILGNGPSLNHCDLSLLANEVTFGVNSIFLNYPKMGFHPTYYVVEDVLVAEDRAAEINSYQGPRVKFFGNYLRYCLEARPDVTWLNVCYRFEDYPGFPHFSTNASQVLWVGGTVSYLCMQLAWSMGFSRVYLVGFDHNYAIPASAQVSGTEILSTEDDPNHFHPDYFGKGYRWHDPLLSRMEQAYRRARSVFEKAGRGIYNATMGGQLEVFPRVAYDSLFQSGPDSTSQPRRDRTSDLSTPG